MTENSDRSGLALAALVLVVSRITADLRAERIGREDARALFADSRALIRDFARFDEAIAIAADELLSIAEALAQPDAPRMPGAI